MDDDIVNDSFDDALATICIPPQPKIPKTAETYQEIANVAGPSSAAKMENPVIKQTAASS